MSYRDRYHGFAVAIGKYWHIACLTDACICIGSILYRYGNDVQSLSEENAQRRTAKYSQETYQPVYERCTKSLVPDPQSCLVGANEAARENERGEHDLVAQETSAVWGRVTAISAILGFCVSGIGLGLIWAAYRAALHTNLIAREIGQAQVRAYLTVSKIEVVPVREGDNILWSISIHVENTGQSTAKYVRANGFPTDKNTPIFSGGNHSVAAGKSDVINMLLVRPSADIEWLNETTVISFGLMVKIYFQDVFMSGPEQTVIDGAVVGRFIPIDGKIQEFAFIEV